MSFFAQDNGSSLSKGGGFAAYDNVDSWSQNQASSSAAFASTSSHFQPTPIHLQRVEVDVPTRLHAPPSEDQQIHSEAPRCKHTAEEGGGRSTAAPTGTMTMTTATAAIRSAICIIIPNVVHSNLNTRSQTSPWWNPGRIGLGLGTAQLYQGAAFAPDMASIHSAFKMINLAVQVGPTCYPAQYKLVLHVIKPHIVYSVLPLKPTPPLPRFMLLPDIIAALPYAAPSQYPAQAQIQPLPSWQQSQQPSDSEPSSYQPLDAQSSFWNTAGRYCRYTSSLVQGIPKSHQNRASFTQKHASFYGA
ncbi:hypothetical protein BT96DRAFT_1009193 [Gymnopus androsaceus JB14]|uniref:Uncharacterized protein n=1 Tax=Gymnopus androsaceus JB14 TaxID=1447944 RepID=A0A6A4GD93_9AGAR|nr:hypothetical protein BT96DRAFT_1009193 [Gymnopus androsaceus JB14]